MTHVVNELRDTTALVERYMGSAYDTVKRVSDELDSILSLYTELQDFKNTWLGNHSEAPILRPNGLALEEGDRYYNTTTKTMYILASGNWVNQNQAQLFKEVFTISAAQRVGNDIVLTLANTYIPGSGALLVDVQGVTQISLHDDAGGSYQETNSNTVTFPGLSPFIADGEKISVTVNNILDFVTPIVSVNSGLYIVETTNQYELPLPNGMVYSPGKNNITVHVNGLLKFSGLDYTESSPTSVYMTVPLQPLDEVVFSQGSFVSNVANQLSNFAQLPTVSSFYDNRDFIRTTQTIFCNGGTTVGDGSGGTFVYDVTADRSLANGVTMVDAIVPRHLQGTAAGNGCWVRQYESFIHPAWFNTPNRGIAAIRSLKGISGDLVHIEGFYEGTVIGGGTFIWKPNMPATQHNGGTIISPQVTAAPGTVGWYVAPLTGNGCWVRQEESKLSVTWFGGSVTAADSSDAFSKALLIGNPEVPSGTYNITATIVGNFYSYGTTAITGGGNVTSIKNLLV